MNKYRNIKTSYNGIMFDSQLEVQTAKELNLLKSAGEIIGYERQYRLDVNVHGRFICFYKADFYVYHEDDQDEIIECKGVFTSTSRLKLKLIKALYPNITITIYQKKKRWEFKK